MFFVFLLFVYVVKDFSYTAKLVYIYVLFIMGVQYVTLQLILFPMDLWLQLFQKNQKIELHYQYLDL